MGEYERLRYTVLVNREKGKCAVIDQFHVRLKKLRMRVVAWSELVEEYRRENKCRMIMVGLTLRKPEDYKAGHIRKYVKALKQKYGEKLVAWAWVAELQERGAIHYHVMIVLPKGTRFPYPDKSGMWKHGSSSVTRAKTPFYLVKYVGKEHQKDLSKYPKGCRLYATSLRFGGDRVKNLYRRLSGITGEGEDYSEGWAYVGSTVTKGYSTLLSESVL